MALPISSPPERRKGFTPLPNECLWDWSRLVSGDAQVLSILFLNSELHPVREKGAPPLEWTPPISKEILASFCRCTVRALEYAFDDLLKRKVVLRKKGSGGDCYSIPFETWAGLPDRPRKVVAIGEAETAEEEGEEEAKKPRGPVLTVWTKPQRVRAGGRTKPKDVPGIVGKLQLEAESEIEFDARLCDGILTVRAKGEVTAKLYPAIALRDQKAKQNEIRFAKTTPNLLKTHKTKTIPLHALLDDYCRRHHGTIPNDKLLTKVCQAMGKASVAQFQAVFAAKVRAGKPVPMGLLINLAEDARLGAETPTSRPCSRSLTRRMKLSATTISSTR